MKKCIFAGTFDPPTLGHLDTIEQAAKIFDEVVVAILINPQKAPFFTQKEREEMVKLLCRHVPVRVMSWQGGAADLLQEENTPFYVRGIRNTIDFEYENAALYASRKYKEDMIAVYLPARQEHLHISSTLARNCIRFGKPVSDCTGEDVAAYIESILKERGETLCLKNN